MIVLQNMVWLWKLTLKLTRINSRLEMPLTSYVAQCNTQPNNNKIANKYMYVTIWSPLEITRNSSRARQPLSRVNLIGFSTLTFKIANISFRRKNNHTHTHSNFSKSWLCPNFSCCVKNVSCPNFGERATAPPPQAPAHTPMYVL